MMTLMCLNFERTVCPAKDEGWTDVMQLWISREAWCITVVGWRGGQGGATEIKIKGLRAV